MLENDLRSLWEQRLAEFESSGKNIKTWCTEQGIKENQFYYWRRKLKSKSVESGKLAKWIPLTIDKINQGNPNYSAIALRIGQVTIEVKNGFDQHLLREIVRVLQTI